MPTMRRGTPARASAPTDGAPSKETRAVSLVYVDRSALLLPPIDPGAADDLVAPGARDALTHLVEAGYEVVLLGDAQAAVVALPAGVSLAVELPEHLDDDAWYLTGAPYPAFGRPRGGTTVLVGPRQPQGKVPLPRFDLETRDLSSAAMEILTRAAMA
jgi:hypothetical protein